MIKIIKRILSLSIVIVILMFTACSDSKNNTIFPKDSNPPYTAENPYVVENLDYMKYNNGIENYCSTIKYDEIEDLISAIKNPRDATLSLNDCAYFIVKKTKSKSYYWNDVAVGNITGLEIKTQLVRTLSEFEIVKILFVNDDAAEIFAENSFIPQIGSAIILSEPYGISPNGEFLDNRYVNELITVNSKDDVAKNIWNEYSVGGVYHRKSVYNDVVVSGYETAEYLKNDVYYLLKVRPLWEINNDQDVILYGAPESESHHQKFDLSLEIPKFSKENDFSGYSIVEVSEDAYSYANSILSNKNFYDKETVNKCISLKIAFENYGHLVPSERNLMPIVISITLGVVMLGIITVGIILRKRKTAAVPTDPTPPTDDEAPPEE